MFGMATWGWCDIRWGWTALLDVATRRGRAGTRLVEPFGDIDRFVVGQPMTVARFAQESQQQNDKNDENDTDRAEGQRSGQVNTYHGSTVLARSTLTMSRAAIGSVLSYTAVAWQQRCAIALYHRRRCLSSQRADLRRLASHSCRQPSEVKTSAARLLAQGATAKQA